MITREFEKEFTPKHSNINNMLECNVLYDFNEYLKDLLRDLGHIKKHHSEEFNSYSKVNIDKCIEAVKALRSKFLSICIKPEFLNDVGFLEEDRKFKDDLFTILDGKYIIRDKYYKVLSKLAKEAFLIEDNVSNITNLFWKDCLTDIDKYDENGNYFLLAHVDYKIPSQNGYTHELKDFNQNQNGLCFSVVSDKKTRLYDNSLPYYSYYRHPNGIMGFIAKPKNGIICASYDDMLSTEYIDGSCALRRYFDHSKINRCYLNGRSQICARGTKIFPPRAIFDLSVDTINEVILDKNEIEITAVFYVKDKDGNKPFGFDEYKKQKERELGISLKEIELKPRNHLAQYNLEEVYMN